MKKRREPNYQYILILKNENTGFYKTLIGHSGGATEEEIVKTIMEKYYDHVAISFCFETDWVDADIKVERKVQLA